MNRSSFVTPLIVSPMLDGKRWWLQVQFTYERWCKRSRDRITVPNYFVFDFASIPKLLMLFLPMWAKFNKASVLHDYLYRYGAILGITRYWADYVFYEAMLVAFRKHRSGKIIAYMEWLAVRLFGWLAYRRRPITGD